MTAIRSTLDTAGEEYAAAAKAMEAKLAEVRVEADKAIAGGGPKYIERHRKRGKLLARERVELLIDEDSPFLELCTFAAWGSDFPVGGNVVAGIGVVEGVECVIVANDPTSRGGASNPWTLKKIFRINDICEQNRLPMISLVESAGADLPTQKEVFVPGGRMFRDLTRASAAGIPTVALVFGNSTAGGAYIPGMSDHVVMIKERSKVFLGGPPLVKMATGEESDDESLGGAEMHARKSGLADYLAQDEQDAIRLGRAIVKRLNWQKQGPAPRADYAAPLYPEEDLGPAEDDGVGAPGVLPQLAHDLNLGTDKLARRVWQQAGHVIHRGLGAVHHAEAVGDEGVGQPGQGRGKFSPLTVGLGRLPRVEAEVLQDEDVPVGHRRHGRGGLFADGLRDEGHRTAQELGEPLGDRLKGVLRVGLTLGPAQVRGHDDPRAGVGQREDRRDRGAHPAVIGDGRALQRHVEVAADQDRPAREPVQLLAELLQRAHRRQSLPPTRVTRSTSRLE